METNKELLLLCLCHAEVLSVKKYDNEYYLTVYKYHSNSYYFWRKLKMTWKVLKGEGITTADIILSAEDFDKIRNYV